MSNEGLLIWNIILSTVLLVVVGVGIMLVDYCLTLTVRSNELKAVVNRNNAVMNRNFRDQKAVINHNDDVMNKNFKDDYLADILHTDRLNEHADLINTHADIVNGNRVAIIELRGVVNESADILNEDIIPTVNENRVAIIELLGGVNENVTELLE